MVRSYDIQFTGNLEKPWALILYEGHDSDESLDILDYAVYNDAQNAGEKFLDGHYVSIKVVA